MKFVNLFICYELNTTETCSPLSKFSLNIFHFKWGIVPQSNIPQASIEIQNSFSFELIEKKVWQWKHLISSRKKDKKGRWIWRE